MILLLEVLVALWLVVVSWLVSERLIAERKPWRWWVMAGAILVLVVVAVLRRRPEWSQGPLEMLIRTPGVAWAYAAAVPFALLIPIAKLRHERERRAVRVLAMAVGFWLGLGPLLAPYLYAAFYPAIPNVLDPHGVVLQRETFTCGPAAACSAARLLGRPIDTAALARAARTNPWFGTPVAELKQALGQFDFAAEHARWASLDELDTSAGIPLLVVRQGVLADHWVAWGGLDVEGRHIIHDPASGLRLVESAALHTWWRGHGLVIHDRRVDDDRDGHGR